MKTLPNLLFLLFFFITTFVHPSFAAQNRYEEKTVLVPDRNELEAYKSDEEFQYGEYQDVEDSGISFKWLSEWFDKVFGTTEGGVAWKIFFWSIIGIAATTVLVMLLNTRFSNILTGKPAKSEAEIVVHDEDIHVTGLQELMDKAIQEGRYREALRYRFLILLKFLSDQNLIHWSPDKTNRDYIRELANTGMAANFVRAVAFYEYSWYGNYPIDKAGWERQKPVFDQVQENR